MAGRGVSDRNPRTFCAHCGHGFSVPWPKTPEVCPGCAQPLIPMRVCQRCDAPRRVPEEIKGKGSFCFACRKARISESNRAYHAVYYADPANRQKNRERSRAYRETHYEQVRLYQAIYDEANKERNRERARAWYQANKERHRAKNLRWRLENPGRQREYQRRHYAKLRRNSKRWQEYLERNRLDERMRADRRGRPKRELTFEEYQARYGTGFGSATTVPAEPLRELVRRSVQIEGTMELADRAHVSDKRIREILSGHEQISLVTADRLCVALGLPLSLVYQDAA
jgi:hypothetical protein